MKHLRRALNEFQLGCFVWSVSRWDTFSGGRETVFKNFQSLTRPQKDPGGTGIISYPRSSSGILVLLPSGLL